MCKAVPGSLVTLYWCPCGCDPISINHVAYIALYHRMVQRPRARGKWVSELKQQKNDIDDSKRYRPRS
jgi:hypothetical protein